MCLTHSGCNKAWGEDGFDAEQGESMIREGDAITTNERATCDTTSKKSPTKGRGE
jgi:hypothetical protein